MPSAILPVDAIAEMRVLSNYPAAHPSASRLAGEAVDNPEHR